MNPDSLSPFARAYVECALWSSTDDAGNPMDAAYTAGDISPETLEQMAGEADDFAFKNQADIMAADLEAGRAGHRFWLNRNGHGSGFWDEKDHNSPDSEVAACNRLSDASKAAGSRDLYVGDDGKIYQS